MAGEQYGFYFLIGGVVLLIVAWLWLVGRGFGIHWGWGLGMLLFPPSALVFLFRHFARARAPFFLILLAAVIVAGTYGVNYVASHYGSRGPYEQVVDGKPTITLTQWNGTDYSFLQDRPDIMVLQMANPDVTDQTLELLKGMQKLQELDLNDTHITDAGLKTLAGFPNLQILRLRKTQVTDQGFRDHLMEKENLLEVDVRETQIASKTMREWKAKRKDERKYLK
jgi:Leucine Rich Repeat (LRR) protein